MQGKQHVPLAQRPEATFLPALLDRFLELLPAVIKPEGVKVEKADGNVATQGKPADKYGKDDAMEVDNEPETVDVEVGDEEEAAPMRFFDDPNEPMRLEDLPADPEEAKLLEEDDEEVAPGASSHT